MAAIEIQIYRQKRGLLRRPQWGWRAVSKINGEVVIPPEGYNNRQDMIDEITDLQHDLAKAEIVEVAS